MADKDLTIAIKATGAAAAAADVDKVTQAVSETGQAAQPAAAEVDKIPQAVGKIPGATQPAGQGIDELKEKLRNLREQTQSLGEETKKFQEEQAKTIPKLNAGKAAAVGAGIGMAILRDRLKEINDGINSIDVEKLRKMSPAMAEQLEGMKKWSEWFTDPLDALQRAISGSTIKEAYADLNDQIKLNAEATESSYDRIHGVRLEAIRAETEALKSQEESYRRLIDLQNAMASEHASAAQKEVQIAKLKGGDVALAEANAISAQVTAQVTAQVQELQGNINASKMALQGAMQAEQVAVAQLRLEQDKVAQHIKTAEEAGLKELEQAARTASENSETARTELNGALALFDGKLANVVRDGEIAAATKEKEYGGQMSAAAQKAFDGVDTMLRQTLAQAPATAQQAITEINADFAKVSEAAASKSTEVNQGIIQAATGTAQSIAGVGQQAAQSSAQINQSVNAASKQVTDALNLMTNNMITALGKVAAAGIANANALARQQNQINQLFARIR